MVESIEWWDNIPYGKRNSLGLKYLGFKCGVTATIEMIETIYNKFKNDN